MIEQHLPATGAERVTRLVLRAWIWPINLLALTYAGLPWLAPLLQSWGLHGVGALIRQLYSHFCHQIAERSFFWRGYQVCYCHRCTALYTTIALAGLCCGLLRPTRGLSNRLFALLLLPMAIDGGWHLLDDLIAAPLRSPDSSVGSLNFWLRMITGALAGLGLVLWAYPRMERLMRELAATPLRA